MFNTTNLELYLSYQTIISNIGKISFRILSNFKGPQNPLRDIPEVEITFKDGKKDKFVLSHHVALPHSRSMDPLLTCSYLGHLENEIDATVSLTGCLDENNVERKIYITILSIRSRYEKSFSIDFDGNVVQIKREKESEEKEQLRALEEFFEATYCV